MTIPYKPSAAHWIFPPIVIGILALLGGILIVTRLVKSAAAKTPFFPSGKAFFAAHWDKARLLGTPLLLVLYIFAMQAIGFLWASMAAVFLYNLLYCGVGEIRSLFSAGKDAKRLAVRSVAGSAVISIVSASAVWFLFSRIFKITLP